jgi:chromosome segregation ATPase
VAGRLILLVRRTAPLTYPDPDLDLAQTLQNRIIAGVKAGNVYRPSPQPPTPDGHGSHEVFIATLEKAVAEAETLNERCRQEAVTAVERVESLEAKIATLERTVTEAEALTAKWREEAATAAKRVEALEANIAALEEAVTEAEGVAEQHRRDAKVAAKRVDSLVAELFEMTSEHVEMSTRIAEHAAGTRRIDSV